VNNGTSSSSMALEGRRQYCLHKALRRAISASYRRLSKPPVHANKGKSVSTVTDKMGKTD
jgi:hypothetical protein